jgi:hypothetical protein
MFREGLGRGGVEKHVVQLPQKIVMGIGKDCDWNAYAVSSCLATLQMLVIEPVRRTGEKKRK